VLDVLLKFAATFLGTVVLHVIVWRIHRPLDYRAWIGSLLTIFVIGGGAIAAAIVTRMPSSDPRIGGPLVEWCAVFLLQGSIGVVYTFGYTLLLVGSPSLIILQRLSVAPNGLLVEEIGLPMTSDALVGFRVNNLIHEGYLAGPPGPLTLTPKGARIARSVNAYRHLLGLRDGEGG